MKKTLSWLMVLLMVFSPFAATVINASAEVQNQDNTVISSDEQDGTPSETEQSPVDTISSTMTSETILAPEPTDPPYEVVVVHPEGGHFTEGKEGYESLRVTLKTGRQLPDSLGWWEPVRDGYRFAGWYAKKNGDIDKDKVYNKGDEVPKEVTDLYAGWVRVVVLDATPGSFNDSDAQQNYTRTVDIKDGKLPKEIDTPVFNPDEKDNQSVEFDGWYTKKTTITRTEYKGSGTDGGYWTLSIQNNGDQIKEGEEVAENITTLYAGYKLKEGVSPKKTITYYYDWNGIDGMWGHCLTSSRTYSDEDHGHKLTAGDLLIRYLNWDGENNQEVRNQEELNKYWQGKKFNGYTFLGWAKTPNAEKPDVEVGNVVKNGDSLYAVWEKDGEYSKDFDRSESPVGPLTAMRFQNLSMSAHGTKDASLTVELYITPLKANLNDLTWTLTYGEPREISEFAPPVTKTGTVKDGETFTGTGFTATVNAGSHTLTITNTDGKEHGITISATAVSDTGETVSTPASATVSFTHKWELQENGEHQEPTCTKKGADTYKCSDCGVTETKAIPPLEHLWKFQITKEATCDKDGIMQEKCIHCNTTFEEYQKWMKDTYGKDVKPAKEAEVIPATGHNFAVTSTNEIDEKGMRCFTEECHDCHTTESGQYGDVNKDGEVSLADVVQMYQFVDGQVDTLSQEAAGDIDGSDGVTQDDADQLCQYVSGQSSSL